MTGKRAINFIIHSAQNKFTFFPPPSALRCHHQPCSRWNPSRKQMTTHAYRAKCISSFGPTWFFLLSCRIPNYMFTARRASRSAYRCCLISVSFLLLPARIPITRELRVRLLSFFRSSIFVRVHLDLFWTESWFLSYPRPSSYCIGGGEEIKAERYEKGEYTVRWCVREAQYMS